MSDCAGLLRNSGCGHLVAVFGFDQVSHETGGMLLNDRLDLTCGFVGQPTACLLHSTISGQRVITEGCKANCKGW